MTNSNNTSGADNGFANSNNNTTFNMTVEFLGVTLNLNVTDHTAGLEGCEPDFSVTVQHHRSNALAEFTERFHQEELVELVREALA